MIKTRMSANYKTKFSKLTHSAVGNC